MKPNELMIGDWVIDAGITSRTVYKRINRTDERSNSCVADDYKVILGEAGIKPIPITPEILEANGFESRELYHFTLYQFGKDSFSIAYNLLLKNLCAFTKTVQAGCRLCTTPDKSELSIQIQYVHELQQAMRLIGLRDLADNFVIEKGGAK